MVWDLFGPPLRPHRQDVEVFRGTAAASREVVLLGVTPELSEKGALPARILTAIDSSAAMIGQVWPGNALGRRVIQGSWMQIPLLESSVDAVLGDGCTTGILWPGEYARLGASVARVLKPGGILHLRCFCATGSEMPVDVERDYRNGRFSSFHAFKLSLAMSLQKTSKDGVQIGRVLEWMVDKFGTPEKIAEERGWPVDVVRTVENYRGSEARYYFPTVREVSESLSQNFRFYEMWSGSYELAGNCPHLMLRRR